MNLRAERQKVEMVDLVKKTRFDNYQMKSQTYENMKAFTPRLGNLNISKLTSLIRRTSSVSVLNEFRT